MISVYISSTYKDLADHRSAVAHALRRMNKLAVAMEDYTSSDARPLDKCLSDVDRCDIYVGIFAHRYGFVPTQDNRTGLSITELELKKATDAGKHCLIFIVSENAFWSPPLTDYFTGENGRGERVMSLRARLRDRYVVSEFSTADDLAKLVAIAVSNVVEARGGKQERDSSAQKPLPREISSGLFLAHLDADFGLARDIQSYWPRSLSGRHHPYMNRRCRS